MVAILLAEQCYCTKLLGLFNGNIAVVGKGNVFAYAGVYNPFYLFNLFVCYFLEMREVETYGFGCYK